MGHDHLLSGLLLTAAVVLTGCSSPSTPEKPAVATSPAPPSPGSDADLPLPPAPSVPEVRGVPAARVAEFRAALQRVWGVRLTAAGDEVRGTGADADTGVRFTVRGRTAGPGLRGYWCAAAPRSGSFGAPVTMGPGDEPAPDQLAATETALGFLQTCANSSAADPDRATVWVRAVSQQVLAGTPAERRIGGVLFRLERHREGLRLTVGST